MLKQVTQNNPAVIAKTLSDALPLLQRYDGAIVVIKIGGHAIGDDAEMEKLARDIALMKQVNVNPVIVHGGGPMINKILEKQGVKSEFVDGKRVTDSETMKTVEMVLSGSVNKHIVAAINKQGGKAIGLSGKDANLMVCKRSEPDLGFVGEPIKINDDILRTLLDGDYIPIIAPIGVGEDGQTYNVNGDTAAGAIAVSLNAERLLLLTNIAGVIGACGKVIPYLCPEQVSDLTSTGVITGGMVPKTRTALSAIEGGVHGVVILDGRTTPHALLLELFTGHGLGSLIHK